jgi:hypothetical protein
MQLLFLWYSNCMEHLSVESDAESEYDARVAHIMDTRGLSYQEAELEAGPPPYEKAEIEPASEIPVQRILGGKATQSAPSYHGGDSRGPRGEEEGVGYDNGEPFYFQPAAVLTDIDADKIHRNVTAIKQMLKEQKAGKTPDGK